MADRSVSSPDEARAARFVDGSARRGSGGAAAEERPRERGLPCGDGPPPSEEEPRRHRRGERETSQISCSPPLRPTRPSLPRRKRTGRLFSRAFGRGATSSSRGASPTSGGSGGRRGAARRGASRKAGPARPSPVLPAGDPRLDGPRVECSPDRGVRRRALSSSPSAFLGGGRIRRRAEVAHLKEEERTGAKRKLAEAAHQGRGRSSKERLREGEVVVEDRWVSIAVAPSPGRGFLPRRSFELGPDLTGATPGPWGREETHDAHRIPGSEVGGPGVDASGPRVR